MLGSWSGEVLQTNTGTLNTAEITLNQIFVGQSDVAAITNYPTLGCSGFFRYKGRIDDVFIFEETLTDPSGCLNGLTKKLKLLPDGTIDYSWALAQDERNGQAVLRKIE